MAKECRAKNPNLCRVHGDGGTTLEQLTAVAETAASSKDMDLYMGAREQIDALNSIKAVKQVNFDFSTGDMEAFLTNVPGISLLYRNKMRAILKSEDNEMPRMKELFTEMVRMKEERGNGPMRDDFAAGFIKVFNMNARADMQIAE